MIDSFENETQVFYFISYTAATHAEYSFSGHIEHAKYSFERGS